jgi:3-phosphoshikimate 1-carboxyvinyltransferase
VNVTVARTQELSGEVVAPSSKAYTQRMLVAAALSPGISELSNPLYSDDTKATLRAVKALGAKVKSAENCWTVQGPKQLTGSAEPVDCGESGATLRFMIPVAALASGPTVFALGKSLEKRPIDPLLQSLAQLGVTTKAEKVEDKFSVKVEGGGIVGGKTSMRGDVSSQFVSGLMFACPKARTKTEIVLTTPLESKGYVLMTQHVLAKHGINVKIGEDRRKISISPNQNYVPYSRRVPGDFSSAAFLMAAAAITHSKICVKNLDYTSVQGDKEIVSILVEMGLTLATAGEEVEVLGREGPLNAFSMDARDVPDLVPICAVLACFAKGISKLHHAQRLRYKESDRLMSVYTELRKMGAEITVEESCLTIKGPCTLHGTVVNPNNDHRIAMACAVAALGAQGKTTIQDAECVKKSYPRFFNDLRKLGAKVVGGKFDR